MKMVMQKHIILLNQKFTTDKYTTKQLIQLLQQSMIGSIRQIMACMQNLNKFYLTTTNNNYVF